MEFNSSIKIVFLFLLPFAGLLVSAILGMRYGMLIKKKLSDLKDVPTRAIVGSALGIATFLLAFTFYGVSSRYEIRKDFLLDEVANIRTAYLRAGMLQEPYRSISKKGLIDYVNIRLEVPRDFSKLRSAIIESQNVFEALWKNSETMAANNISAEANSQFTSVLLDIINLHNKQITVGLYSSISDLIFWILFTITFIAVFLLGYSYGISKKDNFIIILMFIFIYSTIIWLILASDTPGLGFAKLNYAPMQSLYAAPQN